MGDWQQQTTRLWAHAFANLKARLKHEASTLTITLHQFFATQGVLHILAMRAAHELKRPQCVSRLCAVLCVG